MRRAWATLLPVIVLFGACGNDASTTPEARAVSLSTTACGHASRTTGSGVIVEDGWVLASAHVVVGAGQVEVTGTFGSAVARIAVLDAEADLALLQVAEANASPIEVAGAEVGDTLALGGGGPSGAITATVLRPVEVRIEGIRSTERTSRLGYEIDARVSLGDSGDGVFDQADALVGVVFGRPLAEENRSFVVRHEEINRVLSADRTGDWSCDPAQHRVVLAPG